MNSISNSMNSVSFGDCSGLLSEEVTYVSCLRLVLSWTVEVCWSCTDRPAWISCVLSWCPPRSYCSVWSPAAGFLTPDPSAGLQALSVPEEEHENMRDEVSVMCFIQKHLLMHAEIQMLLNKSEDSLYTDVNN